MKKFRFEITNYENNENNKNILTIGLLDGDFIDGKLHNISCEFESLDILQSVLNISVNRLLEEYK